jgi:hypothetical protein
MISLPWRSIASQIARFSSSSADRPVAGTAGTSVTVRRRQMRETTTAEVRLDAGKNSAF